MSHKKLESWLKILLILLAVCGLIFFGYIIPVMKAQNFALVKGGSLLWIVLYLITAIPCYAVLLQGWGIAKRIGENNSFCKENTKALKIISNLALADTIYFFLVKVGMLICGLTRMDIIFMSMLIIFVGAAISGAAAILSHLVEKARIIKEENEEII